MPEQLLTVLKICMLVLLYLFFLRVLRAVWAEVKEPALAQEGTRRPRRAARRRAPATVGAAAPAAAAASPPTRRKMAAAPRQLVPIDGTEASGVSFGLLAEMTIGRAPSCTIEVTDNYASAVHTRIFRREDGWYVEDLGSTNGTYLNRRKVSGPTLLAVGDTISVGNCTWEVQ